jgi:hypothetical protein
MCEPCTGPEEKEAARYEATLERTEFSESLVMSLSAVTKENRG